MARVLESYEAHIKKIDNKGELQSAEIAYVVLDARDENDALNSVLSSAPERYENAFLTAVEIESRDNDTSYRVNAIYEKSSDSSSGQEENDPQMSFDCSGGTAHIVHAISQRKCVLDEGAPDPGCMIGWNGEIANSEFAGVDIITPQMRESYTRRMRPSALSTEFKRTIAELTGCVNSSKFKGWERGEVLFAGASFSGSSSGSDLVTVTYNFMIQRNESNATIGTLVLGDKFGWEYVWTITENRQTGKSVEVVLKQACVAQVYPFGNFNKLGL